jgi:hypothetical protein
MTSEIKMSKLKKKNIEEELESWFLDATSWDKTWRDNAKLWYDYYHGRHWKSDEIAALEERGQAVTTYNHIKPAIDSIIGSERQNRPKTTMAGRGLEDEQVAEAKTKLYDYIQYNSNTDDELDRMVLDACVTGRGWIHVHPEIDKDKTDIKHTYVDYRDMFIDGLSKNDDLSDCRYIHYAVYTDEDVIKKQFRNYKPDNGNTESMFGFESSADDELWYHNSNRKRPRLINTWYRDEEGDISTVIWVKGQVLFFKKKPYEMNEFPFVQYVLDRDMDNMPYGKVKVMTSAQDEVNKRHSKALHYLNAKQVLAEEDAFVDWNDAKKTLAKPDGITKLHDGALSQGKVQVIDNTVLANTHIEMMNIAKNNILYLAGLNPASVGQSGQYESAKKANMSIAQAQNSIVSMLNKLRITRWRLANITMKLVPDFFTDERVIRIIEPNGKYAYMPVNQVKLLDDGTLVKLNDMTVDDVDVIIEDAPKGLNEKEEQFAQLLQIQGQTSMPIPMEILLRYSSIKDKHQLADDLQNWNNIKAQLEQATQVIEQLQGQIQQMGGTINQKDSQITQIETARKVEKEVNKTKEKLNAQLGSI